MGQRPLVMWSAVCSAPHSQLSFVDNPQRSMLAPNLPTPVRSLFSRVHARRGRPTPCPLFDGVGMNLCSLVVVDAHDSAHLALFTPITQDSIIYFCHYLEEAIELDVLFRFC